jgi:hypothetical protein
MIDDSIKQLKVLQTEYEIILKGIIQRYNHDLIQNKMKAK